MRKHLTQLPSVSGREVMSVLATDLVMPTVAADPDARSQYRTLPYRTLESAV